ncbi:hypothetical protein NKR23_g12125 [Pleurostoma richardsiae]|uniref:Uncharacterized protein n=1 Tax=Pleurostoma richardsiae TaxID=41990 RepID=A0AA38R8F0_9PEZI|nr:hypothetical protein NKR23_g12125 [Pleurostoma richardsiae]
MDSSRKALRAAQFKADRSDHAALSGALAAFGDHSLVVPAGAGKNWARNKKKKLKEAAKRASRRMAALTHRVIQVAPDTLQDQRQVAPAVSQANIRTEIVRAMDSKIMYLT